MGDLEPITYEDIDGNGYTIPGKRFPMGKNIPIIDEFLHLAEIIGLKAIWKEAGTEFAFERDQFNQRVLQLGDEPLDGRPDFANGQTMDDASPEWKDYAKKYNSIPRPATVFQRLQDRLLPELVNLVKESPKSFTKMVAIAITPAKELEAADREGRLAELVNEKVSWVEWNLGIDATVAVLQGIFRFTGFESFFNQMGITPEEGEPESEPETTETESPPKARTTKPKPRTSQAPLT